MFGIREAANEEMYFRKQREDQLRALGQESDKKSSRPRKEDVVPHNQKHGEEVANASGADQKKE